MPRAEYQVKGATWNGPTCSCGGPKAYYAIRCRRCNTTGRRVSRGYVGVLMPDHPRATGGYVLEHIVVAERAIGHRLPPAAVIHHVNDNKADNAPTNLVACEDQAYHMLIHARRRIVRMGGDPRTDRICGRCEQLRPRTSFKPAPKQRGGGLSGYCRDCHNAAGREYSARKAQGGK